MSARILALAAAAVLAIGCTPGAPPPAPTPTPAPPPAIAPPAPTVPLRALLASSAGRWHWEHHVPGTPLLRHYQLQLSLSGGTLRAVLTYSTDTVWDSTPLYPAVSSTVSLRLRQGSVDSATLGGIRAVLPGQALPIPAVTAAGSAYLAMIGTDGQTYRVGYMVVITGKQLTLTLRVGAAYLLLHTTGGPGAPTLSQQMSIHFPAPGAPGQWIDLRMTR